MIGSRANRSGAIANAVAEVDILAETGDIGAGAAKLASLAKHVVDAELLKNIRVSDKGEHDRKRNLTPQDGRAARNPATSWATLAAAKSARATKAVFILKARGCDLGFERQSMALLKLQRMIL